MKNARMKFFVIYAVIVGRWFDVAAREEKSLSKSVIPRTSIHVDLSGKNFTTMDNDTFDGSMKIVDLSLAGNYLRVLPKSVFSPLGKLTNLNLSGNFIQDTTEAFVGLNNLKDLDISNNSLNSLGSNYFVGLTNQCRIKIENNAFELFIIGDAFGSERSASSEKVTDEKKSTSSSSEPTEFVYEACARNSTLVQLKIRHNNNNNNNNNNGKSTSDCPIARLVGNTLHLDVGLISKVEKNWYRVTNEVAMSANLFVMKIVDLRSDKLISHLVSELPIYFNKVIIRYGSLPRLKMGTLKHNGVGELSLNSLGTSVIEPGTFDMPKLKILSLYDNRLNDTDSLKNLPATIETLNLVQNGITAIMANTFSHLKNLTILYLDNNKISAITIGAFKNFDNLKELSVRNNNMSDIKLGTFDIINVEILDLRNNSLGNNIASSSSLTLPKNIEILDLSINGFTAITANTFPHLKKLKQLFLDNNLITTVTPGAFEHMDNLEKLALGYNNITSMNLGTFDMINVKILDLRNNRLRNNIASSLATFPRNIEILNLGSNGIAEIKYNTFAHFKKLEELWLDKNAITTIEVGAFQNIYNLKLLSLEYNEITDIKPGTFQTVNLNVLILNNNRMRTIGSLPPTLRMLTLNSNEITAITANSFSNLTNLEKLYIDKNNISTIDLGGFEKLKNLQILSLAYNKIIDIKPDTFHGLNVVKTLNLKNNRIREIGSFPPSTEWLDLETNNITAIKADTFSHLTKLKGLVLGKNQITSIEVGAFKHLENVIFMDLSANRLSRVEARVFNELKNLKDLSLQENSLTRLNPGMLDLPQLYFLDLSYNTIEIIEKGALKNLRQLCRLNIHGNPIRKLENGQLFGFRKTWSCHVMADGSRLNTLEAGLFDDLSL